MTQSIIRAEFQATPTHSLFGKKEYYWRVTSTVGGIQHVLKDGWEKTYTGASYTALREVEKHI